MAFKDVGRMFLEVQITKSLRDYTMYFDIPALIEAYIEKFGFVDLGEVKSDRYWKLVMKYRVVGQKADPSSP